jgi:hypothetical protein
VFQKVEEARTGPVSRDVTGSGSDGWG